MSKISLKYIHIHIYNFEHTMVIMNITISNIRAIIKNFQSTENVTKLPGRGRVSISS